MRHLRQNPPRNKRYWKKLSLEITLVLLVLCITYTISSYFNLSDNYFMWAKAYENSLDIDELPISLLACLATLLWLSERRIYESNMLIKQNHALLQRVLEVQETERKRISQDLHDELGQYLNAIKAQATSLLVDNSSSADTLSTAKRIVETADHGYHAARQMMHSLRPVALDELGLSAALDHLVETWRDVQHAAGTYTHFQINITDNIDQFNESINIGIFRIVQEALTNIAKHANAKNVTINISCVKGEITLHITDDGSGFDIKEKSNGYGLIGMIERAEVLSGNLTIDSGHSGTKLIVTINQPNDPTHTV